MCEKVICVNCDIVCVITLHIKNCYQKITEYPKLQEKFIRKVRNSRNKQELRQKIEKLIQLEYD